jgi:hypothetical protein
MTFADAGALCLGTPARIALALAGTSWRRRGEASPFGKKMAAGETALHVMPFRRLHLGLSSQRSLSATTRVNLALTPGECCCGKDAPRLLSWWTTLADGWVKSDFCWKLRKGISAPIVH